MDSNRINSILSSDAVFQETDHRRQPKASIPASIELVKTLVNTVLSQDKADKLTSDYDDGCQNSKSQHGSTIRKSSMQISNNIMYISTTTKHRSKNRFFEKQISP